MGHLCSCHRVQKSWKKGHAQSQDLLLSRPVPRFKGYGSYNPPWKQNDVANGHYVMPTYTITDLSMSPYGTLPRNIPVTHSGCRKVDYSYSTLGPESGFSSNAHSISAPSTPESMIRQKPPPKPPRMLTSADTLLRTPTPSVRSAGVHSLKSSIVDVTNALDCSLSRSFDDQSFGENSSFASDRGSTGIAEEKVFHILSQTKEFLAFELEPDSLLSYLIERDVITRHEASEIRSCITKFAKCERLIDIITGKSHDDFMSFCEALRTACSHGYLADFLEVLDTLVEIATANIMKPVENDGARSPNLRVRAFSFEAEKDCGLCSCNNNRDNDEMGAFSDDASFDVDIYYIHRETKQARSIREVSAMKRRNRPLTLSEDDKALPEEADKYIPVISASLYNQCLVAGGVGTLSSLLENYHCIRELSLVKNHMNAQSMKLLADALPKNKSLSKLDIRLNYIGDEGAQYLADGVSKHISLRTLKVTSTGLGGEGCSHILRGVTKSPFVSELDIGFNDTTEHACEIIGRCLATNPPLRLLRMRCNGLTPYGARCLFKGLRRNAHVTFLDVSRNKIRDESITTLAEVLLHNRTLREINLENCNLTGSSCAMLARSLKSNMSLRTLDMSMNAIGDGGARSLSEGLKYNQAMDTLCLNMCNIGNSGFLCILNTLRHNLAMTTLKMCYNKIGNPRSSFDDLSSGSSSGTTTPVFREEFERENKPIILAPPPKSTDTTEPISNGNIVNGVVVVNGEETSGGLENGISSSESTLSQSSLNEITRPCTLDVNDDFSEPHGPRAGLPPKNLESSESSPDYENLPCRLGLLLSCNQSQTSTSSPTLQTSHSKTSMISIPRSFFSNSSSPPPTPTSPPLHPRSPLLSPMSPLTATLRKTFTSDPVPTDDSVDQMYETLCEVLQQNKSLKVLLWGNNFDDTHEDRLIQDVTSMNGNASQLRTEP